MSVIYKIGVKFMIKALLENKVGPISNAEFAVICEMVTDDIKFNRISFKKSTSLNYVLEIAIKSAAIFRRCA